MILNEKKTKVMLTTGKWLDKKLEQPQLQFKLNASEPEQVNSQKLLGVTIDSKLSFDDHIDKFCGKLSQRIDVLSRIKRFLPLKQWITYYNPMMPPWCGRLVPLGICRGSFASRSELHMLSLTPTRERTVLNFSRN